MMMNKNYNKDNMNTRTRAAHYIEDNYDYTPDKAYFVDGNAAVARTPAPQPPKKKSRAGLVIATVALTLVAAISVGAFAFFFTNNNKASKPAATIATVSNNGALNGNAPTENKAQTASQAPVKDTTAPTEAKTEAPAPAPTQGTVTPGTAPAATETPAATDTPAMAVAKRAYPGHNLEMTQESNVIRVNGERIYMDTKRLAPEKTGNPAHFYANGATSYGFDWNYKTDNVNFVIACNYNFAKQQYDFTFYGTQAGVSHITVYYNTADNVQIPVQLTINVDENLNVTQG